MAINPSTPVIVGVGQFTERVDTPGFQRMSAVDLAAAAVRAALIDSGADSTAVLAAVDVVVGLRQFENSAPVPTPLGRSNNLPDRSWEGLALNLDTLCWNPSVDTARKSW